MRRDDLKRSHTKTVHPGKIPWAVGDPEPTSALKFMKKLKPSRPPENLDPDDPVEEVNQ